MSTENNDWTTAPDYHDAQCDFCDQKAQYDAMTIYAGQWAFLCEHHFQTKTTRRLGMGLGQRLIPITEETR